ncbi:MAG: hypothetical protein A3A86_03230 [Elusimicrobia bacterium RIFCSPLOWO2_01_FULL_60_11]|nr:MAG: hypothetical protein A3A86_03230 [Elusimicrobia bacterium RIFCSPLOWO2_01_FULL_60_11]
MCLGICALFLNGCGDDDIKTYRVSKESQPAAGMPGMMVMPAGAPELGGPHAEAGELQWELPGGWKEQPPSQMRLASFLVPGKNNLNSDVSVVPLSGAAGGDLDNINRWRGQIQLEPITQADLPRHMKIIKTGGKSMHFVSFVSAGPLIEGRFKSRVMAAYFHDGERTWFFKMTGEDGNVSAAKDSFLRFLGSLRFAGHDHE